MTTLTDGRSASAAGDPDRPSVGSSTRVHDDAAVPARASGIEMLGQQLGSGYRVPPALVRRSDGQILQLTPLTYQVLGLVDGARSYPELADAFAEAYGRVLAPEDVQMLVEQKLRPLGLIRMPDGSEPPVRKANPLLALRFRYVVSDPDRTRRLTAPFAALFHPALCVLGSLAFAVVAYWVLFQKGLASAAREAFASPGLLLAVFLITVVSAGFHEFGHAAALRRGGGTPGAMGAGLYLVWPAFYTDVTDSYRLSRAARIRTDLGGLYFNALVSLAMFGVWAAVRWDGLLLVIATQILQMIRQLPPMIRFDGYHLLADVTGVPDLFHRIKPTLLSFWPTRWRHPQSKVLRPWVRVVVTLWVVAVVPLMLLTVVITVVTLPRIIATAARSLDVQWTLLTGRWHSGDWLGVGAKALAVVAVIIPVFGILFMLTRSVRQLAKSVWRRTAGKPVRRAVAVATAAALVAALVYVWWPRGNYRAIQPGERGTVQEAIAAAPVAELTHRLAGTEVPAQGATRQLHEGDTVSARTVWATGGAPLPTRAHPVLSMVLSPRSGSGDAPTWVFPFNKPDAPGPGDNQALAIATKDNSTVYDVSFALVWATGDTVLNKNEAYAFASCANCTAVAVSFQVVLIVGNAHVVAPQNISAAVSYHCIRCLTAALAVQLDLTLTKQPDASTTAKLTSLWAQIQRFAAHLKGLTFAEIHDRIEGYEKKILAVVRDYVTVTQGAAASSSDGPAGSTAPLGPSDSASSSDTSAPTAGATTAESTQSGPVAASSSPAPSGTTSDTAGNSTSGTSSTSEGSSSPTTTQPTSSAPPTP